MYTKLCVNMFRTYWLLQRKIGDPVAKLAIETVICNEHFNINMNQRMFGTKIDASLTSMCMTMTTQSLKEAQKKLNNTSS